MSNIEAFRNARDHSIIFFSLEGKVRRQTDPKSTVTRHPMAKYVLGSFCAVHGTFSGTNNLQHLVVRLLFDAVVYCIWQEKNQKHYKNVYTDQRSVQRHISDWVRFKLVSCFLFVWQNGIRFGFHHYKLLFICVSPHPQKILYGHELNSLLVPKNK